MTLPSIKARMRTGKGGALRASELSEYIGSVRLGYIAGRVYPGLRISLQHGFVVQLHLISKRIQRTAAKSIESVRGGIKRAPTSAKKLKNLGACKTQNNFSIL